MPVMSNIRALNTADIVMAVTGQYFGMTVHDLRSSAGGKSLMIPRLVAMALARELTGLSYPRLGDLFGRHGPGAICNAVKRVAALQARDHLIARDVEQVRQAALQQIALGERPRTNRNPTPRAEDIQAIVVAYYGLERQDMTSTARGRHFARPRQAAMALTRELTHLSLPQIGALFGGRDHTTVIHAVARVRTLEAEDRIFSLDMERMRRAVFRLVLPEIGERPGVGQSHQWVQNILRNPIAVLSMFGEDRAAVIAQRLEQRDRRAARAADMARWRETRPRPETEAHANSKRLPCPA